MKQLLVILFVVAFVGCENDETYYKILRKESKTDGEYLWKANCGQCHGKDGRWTSLADIRTKGYKRERLQQFIINSDSLNATIDSTFAFDMYPHEFTFSEEELDKLVSHIIKLNRSQK